MINAEGISYAIQSTTKVIIVMILLGFLLYIVAKIHMRVIDCAKNGRCTKQRLATVAVRLAAIGVIAVMLMDALPFAGLLRFSLIAVPIYTAFVIYKFPKYLTLSRRMKQAKQNAPSS